MSTMPCIDGEVILGVDTHVETHTAALVNPLGRTLTTTTVAATRRGHQALVKWMGRRGSVRVAGVEGTGSYGAGLARFLALEGIDVVEVTRTSRKGRRHLGKNDTRDAEAAARSVLSGEATAIPKPRNGIVESIRVLRHTRASAVKSRTQATLQLRNLIITAPDELRDPLAELTTKQAISRCARMRRTDRLDAIGATRKALRTLARRWQALDAECASSTKTSSGSPPKPHRGCSPSPASVPRPPPSC
jgi:transposase